MAINWPTLKRNMDWGSTITRTPNLEVNQLGDGYAVRIPQGINHLPGEFNIVYTNMDPADFRDLLAFVKANSAGQSIRIPVLPEDPTGATTGVFYIKGFSTSGEYLKTMNIQCSEVFV